MLFFSLGWGGGGGAGRNITVSHRSFTGHNDRAFQLLTRHDDGSDKRFAIIEDACSHVCQKMEGKRSSSASNSSSSSCEIVKKQKRQISIATFNKWQSFYSREHDSLVWLRCDKDREDRTIVSTHWCDV